MILHVHAHADLRCVSPNLPPCPSIPSLFCRKLLNCFRGQINTVKAKKEAKTAGAKSAKTQEPELPKTLDPAGPKAEPPVKFLSLSLSGMTQEVSAQVHATRMYKQNSSGSQQSSAGIPVGPITGPAHSVTPWAECDDESAGRDQGGPVAPTAASLAAAAHGPQGGLYRDSNSFRQWAASAVQSPGTVLRK